MVLKNELWYDEYSHKYRIYPHLICENLWDGRYRCVYCGLEGDYNKVLSKVGCTERKKPCLWCGQAPLCAPDCVGMRMLLSDPKAHLIGNPYEEK